MPLSADPNAVATFTYETIGGRRKINFHARFITRREKAEHRRIIQSALGKDIDSDEVQAAIRKAIELGVVGWDEPEPYSFEALDGVFDDDNLWAFAQTWPEGVALRVRDLGKSTSRLISLAGDSAATASSAENA